MVITKISSNMKSPLLPTLSHKFCQTEIDKPMLDMTPLKVGRGRTKCCVCAWFLQQLVHNSAAVGFYILFNYFTEFAGRH